MYKIQYKCTLKVLNTKTYKKRIFFTLFDHLSHSSYKESLCEKLSGSHKATSGLSPILSESSWLLKIKSGVFSLSSISVGASQWLIYKTMYNFSLLLLSSRLITSGYIVADCSCIFQQVQARMRLIHIWGEQAIYHSQQSKLILLFCNKMDFKS